jgi:hypothetical protein
MNLRARAQVEESQESTARTTYQRRLVCSAAKRCHRHPSRGWRQRRGVGAPGGENLKVGPMSSTPRADLAQFMLDEVESPQYVGKRVVVRY